MNRRRPLRLDALEPRDVPAALVLKDIHALPPSTGSAPQELVVVGDRLFFAADDGVAGRELWVSDGTEAGTVRVTDLLPGFAGSDPNDLVAFDGLLYFAADDGVNGRELWRSDGTVAGTVRVGDLNPGAAGSDPADLTVVDDTLFFAATTAAAGRELWKVDVGGPALVQDLRPGVVGGEPYQLTASGGFLYFAAFQPNSSLELWRSDGTDPGTVELTSAIRGINLIALGELTDVAGTLFLSGEDLNAGAELWFSSPVVGTGRVGDLRPGTDGFAPRDIVGVNGVAYFSADDGVAGRELWASDGTEAGTRLVIDLVPGAASSDPTELVDLAGTLVFAADGAVGRELWASDGTNPGTRFLADINSGLAGSDPTNLTVVDASVFFAADDGVAGAELWRSDGTAVVRVQDLFPGASSSDPARIVARGLDLFFTATDALLGEEVWYFERGGGSPPQSIDLSDDTVEENRPAGTLVGVLTAIDPDAGSTFTFELAAGTGDDDNARFTIVGDQLLTAEPFNFEAIASYTLRLRVTDESGQSFEAPFTVDVIDVNDRPVVDTAITPMLPDHPKFRKTKKGLVLSEGGTPRPLTRFVTDEDAGAVRGIAVTSLDQANGRWQYRLTAAGDWIDFPAVTPESALLLEDNGETRVRFVPVKKFKGFAGFTFVAWDRTAGVEGTLADTTDAADTSFSLAGDKAWVGVGKTKVKVDPDGRTVLRGKLPVVATGIKPLKAAKVKVVLGIAGLEASTPDVGLAVIGNDSSDGTWQFKLKGTKGWTDIGSAEPNAALVLRPKDRLRFLPAVGSDGPSPLTFVAWKPTDADAGQRLPAVGPDFGVDPGTAVVDLVPILDTSVEQTLPAVSAGGTSVEVAFDAILSATRLVGGNVGVAITKATGDGTWQFRSAGSGDWRDLPKVSKGKALLLDRDAEVRFIASSEALPGTATLSFKAWDQVNGASGERFPARGTGFSKATETLSVEIA